MTWPGCLVFAALVAAMVALASSEHRAPFSERASRACPEHGGVRQIAYDNVVCMDGRVFAP